MAESEPNWRSEATDAIRRLEGVVGAHIRMQGDEIGAILVQTDGSRNSRRIVRDVEAILATIAGIELDYRKVSVAATPNVPGTGRRLAFEHVHLGTSGLTTEARVELSLGSARVVGIATGPATRGSTLELVAEASLKAASQMVEDPVAFSLGGLDRVRVGRGWVLVVLVRFLEGRLERVLTGSCPGGQDDLRAAAVATLDAINRTFASLRVREPIEYILRSNTLEVEPASS